MRIKIKDKYYAKDLSKWHTKTFKYMFGLELSLYCTRLVEDSFDKFEPAFADENWDNINVYLDDSSTTDYDLKEELSKFSNEENATFIYHILVDTRATNFSKLLDSIKTSKNFIDCYQCGNSQTNKAIIRYKVAAKKRIPILVESKYSEMYHRNELRSIMQSQYIKDRYGVEYDDDGNAKFSSPIHILKKDDIAFQRLIDTLGITDSETKSIIRKNEYDSKFNLSNEIINSDKL